MQADLTAEPLPFRRLLDCGMREYQEFACSRRTFRWLRFGGGMRVVDGRPVLVRIVEEIPGGHNVIARADPDEAPPAETAAFERRLELRPSDGVWVLSTHSGERLVVVEGGRQVA